MIAIRWETKKRIYALSLTRACAWWPEFGEQSDDLRSYWWLWFSFDWFSKEWLQFCEEHGGGFESTFEWLESEMREDDSR